MAVAVFDALLVPAPPLYLPVSRKPCERLRVRRRVRERAHTRSRDAQASATSFGNVFKNAPTNTVRARLKLIVVSAS